MTTVIVQTVLSDPATFNAAFLGKSPQSYCNWILQPTSWGGGIELFVFSNYYKVEIASVDIETLRMDVFGQGHGYDKRVYLLYSGIHYDAIAAKPMENSDIKYHKTIFHVDDTAVTNKVMELAGMLHNTQSFTNVSTFSVLCQTCGAKFSGQNDVQQHAQATGHFDFAQIPRNKTST